MKIKIPCPECGCQDCQANMKNGQKVNIHICMCNDGSGEYEVSISFLNTRETTYEKHQCKLEDLEHCINTRFNVDLSSVTHECSK